MSSTQSNIESIPKYEYLKIDAPIPGQLFTCVSFAEPMNQELLTDRESFFASRFLKVFVDEHKQALKYIEEHQDEPDMITDEIKEKMNLSYENVQTMFYTFRQLNFTKLQSEFEKIDKKNERLTMRAVKFRGSFHTQEEAAKKCKELVSFEPATNVFVCQTGYWCIFNPLDLSEVEVEHMNENLNNLVKSKADEAIKRDLEFNARKQKAIESVKKMNDDNKDIMDDSVPVVQSDEPVELKSVEDELFEKASPETQQSIPDSDELEGFTQVKKRRRKINKNRRKVNKRS